MQDGAGLSVIKGQRMLVRKKWVYFYTSSRVAPQEFVLSQQGRVWDGIFCFLSSQIKKGDERL